MSLRFSKFSLTILIFQIGFFSILNAEVLQVKEKDLLLDVSNLEVSKGTKIKIKNSKDKVYGIAEIGSISKSGTKAKAKLIKGKAAVGDTLVEPEPQGEQDSSEKVAEKSKSKKTDKKNMTKNPSKYRWGFLLGYSVDNMKIEPEGSNTSVDNSGSGIAVRLALDYHFTDFLKVRATAGIENFNVKGDASTAVCDGTIKCETKISYLISEAFGQVYVSQDKYRPWVGAGLGLAMPSQSESNAIDEDSIAMTTIILVGAGLDIYVNVNHYIPVQFEYAILPSSETASANYFGIKAGYFF